MLPKKYFMIFYKFKSIVKNEKWKMCCKMYHHISISWNNSEFLTNNSFENSQIFTSLNLRNLWKKYINIYIYIWMKLVWNYLRVNFSVKYFNLLFIKCIRLKSMSINISIFNHNYIYKTTLSLKLIRFNQI